jgi:hypothetical protein
MMNGTPAREDETPVPGITRLSRASGVGWAQTPETISDFSTAPDASATHTL